MTYTEEHELVPQIPALQRSVRRLERQIAAIESDIKHLEKMIEKLFLGHPNL